MLLAAPLLLAACRAPAARAEEAVVESADVARFYAAVRGLPADAGVEAVAERLAREYLAGGSAGLRAFQRARIGSAHELAATYVARRGYYESIERTLLELSTDASLQEDVRQAFARVNRWLPEARFPPTYLVIGRMSSAGTTGRSGLLLGLEMFGRTETAHTAELDAWARRSIRAPEDLVRVIVHEASHTLQREHDPRTLLAAALNEGVCDFLAALATDGPRASPARAYAEAHEAELWAEFSAALESEDWGGWLYSLPADPERPPDLGYVLGAFLCEAYFQRAEDPSRALRDLLDCRKARQILAQSGYDGSAASRRPRPDPRPHQL